MDVFQLFARSHHMILGDTDPYLEGFAAEMASGGHTQLTIRGYLDSAIHFGRWVEVGGLHFADIDEGVVKGIRGAPL